MKANKQIINQKQLRMIKGKFSHLIDSITDHTWTSFNITYVYFNQTLSIYLSISRRVRVDQNRYEVSKTDTSWLG